MHELIFYLIIINILVLLLVL